MAKTLQLKIDLPDKEVTKFNKALKTLGETDAPFIKDAVEDSGQFFTNRVRGHAKGGIASAVAFVGTKGQGASVRAIGVAKHPAAAPMEFGRTNYYRGFKARQQKRTGQKFKASPGQKAEPFVGIKTGDQATAETRPYARERILDGFAKEWDRILGGGE